MKNIFFYPLVLLVLLASTGCAQNGFSKFYTDFSQKYSNLDPATFQPLAADQQPQLMLGTNLQQDSFSMQVNGYVPVGYSSFQGRLESVGNVLSQANKVGATHVLLYSSGVNSAAVSTYQMSDISVSNRFGERPASEQTARFSRGRGYLQAASYWVERSRWEFGAYVEELSPDAKRAIGLEGGCQLAIVVAGTAADRAGLISGDIVLQFAGNKVAGSQGFREALKNNAADTVSLLVYRDGDFLEKAVQLKAENNRLTAKTD